MLGFESIWENKRGHILFQLLEGVDTSSWFWMVEEIESYTGGSDLFSSTSINFSTPVISDHALYEALVSKEVYTIFLNLRGYSEAPKVTCFSTYNEFLTSDCQIAIICYDVTFYEVYAKDKMIIQKIVKNAEKHALSVERFEDETSITRYQF